MPADRRNPTALRFKTMGEIMTEVRVRCSLAAQGSASKNNDAIIKSFVQEAHDMVLDELEPPSQRLKTIVTLQPNSYLYDYWDDENDIPIDPGRVLSMWIIRSSSIRDPLTQGITEADRSNDTIREQPQKYDNLFGQIEVWPIPDQSYPLLIEYTVDSARFSQQSDRPIVSSRLVFQYALAKAKSHYRHPDAQVEASTFERFLRKAKIRQKENRRYFMAMDAMGSSKQVVRNANGTYSLRS